MTSSRPISKAYVDPLDALWLTVAKRIGFHIDRSSEVYAFANGNGVITLCKRDQFDPDDCLAQLVLHELCHSLVEGPESLNKIDWGLNNENGSDVWKEHACLRVQAALLDQYWMRDVLAPTTEFRLFYDQLGEDPLVGPPSDPSVIAAQLGISRAVTPPWHPHLHEGLQATGNIIQELQRFGALSGKEEQRPIWF